MPNLQSYVNRGLRITEVKTQFSTEITKSTVSWQQPFCFLSENYYNLIASLSHLEALCLNVTLMRLTIAYSKKIKRHL